jgi:hypothetical protein
MVRVRVLRDHFGGRLKPRLLSLRLVVRLRGRAGGPRPRRWTAGGTPTRRDFNRRKQANGS